MIGRLIRRQQIEGLQRRLRITVLAALAEYADAELVSDRIGDHQVRLQATSTAEMAKTKFGCSHDSNQ
jgi:hypothetical protein